MASKVLYTAVAVAGIAAASGAAWWFQRPSAKPATDVALAPTGGALGSGAAPAAGG
ncbi:MAG: efflux transporter periplasmic adaptor subunit, partial [Ramlibacter sp.]|nr:efflux transporter periplasmic adaptor subunit [Ramlibacter sp.]